MCVRYWATPPPPYYNKFSAQYQSIQPLFFFYVIRELVYVYTVYVDFACRPVREIKWEPLHHVIICKNISSWNPLLALTLSLSLSWQCSATFVNAQWRNYRLYSSIYTHRYIYRAAIKELSRDVSHIISSFYYHFVIWMLVYIMPACVYSPRSSLSLVLHI